jgi:NAD+ synthase
LHIDITPLLTEFGAYEKRDHAIKQLIPEYSKEWKSKIIINNMDGNEALHYFSIVALSPKGRRITKRLDKESYLHLIAATNFKQRVRKILEYYHADRLNYAVAGTPNKLEYDQGFFVKLGDGAADVKPIAHLYKSQVYQIAEYLKVPENIRRRRPTTDTYSLSQSQEEFFFSLPYEKMDLCLYGKTNNYSKEAVAELTGMTSAEVEKVYKDIEQKRKSTEYLHLNSLILEDDNC